jgi:hypothetical protein
MGLVTDWINARKQLMSLARASLAESLAIIRAAGEGSTYLVPIYRLELLAARHRTHSLEILRKRASCGRLHH